MNKTLTNLMFLLVLMMSTFISISATSWLGVWMGLEINLLSFIPLMSDNKNLMSNESMLKYFLVQAIASSILLLSIIMMFLFLKKLFLNLTIINLLIMTSLFMKMGAAPFHFWLPLVMSGLSWINNFILMTWQKITPILILSYKFNNNFLISIIMLSIIISSIKGLNQTSLQKIMAYSSINHLGWMLSSLIFNAKLWWNYFFIYFFILMFMVMMFFIFQLYFLNQFFFLFSIFPMSKIIVMSNFLSLGGLPPFLGFLPKWLVIQNMTFYNFYILLFIMLLFTLITLFFYLRLSFSSLMLNNYMNNWNLNIKFFNKFKWLMFLLMISSMSLLPMICIIPLLY